ncbi:MAG: hypothetical protein AAB066_02545 [Candidatus Margulisiibacteriota bacterium]
MTAFAKHTLLSVRVLGFLMLSLVMIGPVFGTEGSLLDLENPDIGRSATPETVSAGPIQNINFGGAFDARFLVPSGEKGRLLLHVSELVLTATIGDNISILAEQLLQTDDLVSVVGQDHGFAYAIFSNYPFFPEGFSVKVGRFRAKWGYDARSDSASNMIQSLAIRSVGQITDLGIEVSGYLAQSVDFNIALQNGPNTLFIDTTDGTGGTIQAKNMAENPRNSYFARLYNELSSNLGVGVSYFSGNSYSWRNGLGFSHETMQVYGTLDRSQLVGIQRYAIDAALKVGKWTFNGEFGFGSDTGPGAERQVQAYMGRLDYDFVPGVFSGMLQIDYIHDGDSGTEDQPIGSIEGTVRLTDTSVLRPFYIRGLRSGTQGQLMGIQLLLSF